LYLISDFGAFNGGCGSREFQAMRLLRVLVHLHQIYSFLFLRSDELRREAQFSLLLIAPVEEK
jgi:hypothetical protein